MIVTGFIVIVTMNKQQFRDVEYDTANIRKCDREQKKKTTNLNKTKMKWN